MIYLIILPNETYNILVNTSNLKTKFNILIQSLNQTLVKVFKKKKHSLSKQYIFIYTKYKPSTLSAYHSRMKILSNEYTSIFNWLKSSK